MTPTGDRSPSGPVRVRRHRSAHSHSHSRFVSSSAASPAPVCATRAALADVPTDPAQREIMAFLSTHPTTTRRSSDSSQQQRSQSLAPARPHAESSRSWSHPLGANPPAVSRPPPFAHSASDSALARPSAAAGSERPREQSLETELDEVMRRSKDEAELERLRLESTRLEEERLLRLTSSYSAEQEHLRQLRLHEDALAEEAALREAMAQSRSAKGKQPERAAADEDEMLQLALAMSLSEAQSRRARGGVTSAERFAQLSRAEPTGSSWGEPARQDSFGPTPHPLFNDFPEVTSPTPLSPAPEPDRQRFVVANPDEELPPPAYEYPSTELNPRTVVLGPGRPLPVPPLHAPPTASTSHAVASTSHAPPSTSRARRPSHPGRVDSAKYYSAPIAAAFVADDAAAAADDDDDEDPFADSQAVVPDEHECPRDLWEITHRDSGGHEILTIRAQPEREDSPRVQVDSPEPSPELESRSPSPTPAPSTALQPTPSPSLRSSSSPNLRSSPLFGGLVDSASTNAIADDQVLHSVRFGFVVVGPQRTVLEHEGAFPDVAQLSRVGGPEGDSDEFECFAVEAGGWDGLLKYLMWHGNSHLEAAPRDLQSEKSGRGLDVALVVQFFRSSSSPYSPRVRVLVRLLPPNAPPPPPESLTAASASPSFSASSPSITILLPTPPRLPLTLASVALLLSAAHTTSRRNAHDRAMRSLAPAVDLFKRLNGEAVVEDAEEVEEAEKSLLRKVRGRMRFRKRAPGVVKGGADGTGGGRPLEPGRPLPEGALLVTPFRLDDA